MKHNRSTYPTTNLDVGTAARHCEYSLFSCTGSTLSKTNFSSVKPFGIIWFLFDIYAHEEIELSCIRLLILSSIFRADNDTILFGLFFGRHRCVLCATTTTSSVGTKVSCGPQGADESECLVVCARNRPSSCELFEQENKCS